MVDLLKIGNYLKIYIKVKVFLEVMSTRNRNKCTCLTANESESPLIQVMLTLKGWLISGRKESIN